MKVIHEFKASIGDLTLLSDSVTTRKHSDWTLLHDGSPMNIEGEFDPTLFREIAQLLLDAADWMEGESE